MLNLDTTQSMYLAKSHLDGGRLKEAEAVAREILNMAPNHPGAFHILGLVAIQEHRYDLAIAMFQQALRIMPGLAVMLGNLGLAFSLAGNLDEAEASYRKAIDAAPENAVFHFNLASICRRKGDLPGAIAAYRATVTLNDAFPDGWHCLANAYFASRQFEEAVAGYRRAVAHRPEYAASWCNMGNAFRELGKPDEAIPMFTKALSVQPDSATTMNNLGAALKDKGLMRESIAAFRRAAAMKTAFASVGSSLLFAMQFDPVEDVPAMAEELRRWNDQYASRLPRFPHTAPRDRDLNRRLRIGYVSPDFRNHCQAKFMMPLLKAHDHSAVEVFCYADVPQADALTRAMQQLADRWRDVSTLTDEQLAAQIREDQIDILVDLTMHMAGNRLLLFARKPAPIQATWLAYPGTTGLSAIDYRLSDPHLDPPGGDESIYSEQTLRLPHTFWCYDPLDGRDIPVNELPALKNGHITFGCLNNFCKVNDRVLPLWAKVLRQVEGSRLLLLAYEGDHRARAIQAFQAAGVAADRVEFLAPCPVPVYLRTFHRIDLCLDTFPVNGHTTSLDGLFMGVPVVTLVAKTILGRAGLSQMTNLGMTDLVAHNEEQYQRLAAELAENLPRLKELRATLRQRMKSSVLMDGPAFARGIEEAFRRMWRAWCASSGST